MTIETNKIKEIFMPSFYVAWFSICMLLTLVVLAIIGLSIEKPAPPAAVEEPYGLSSNKQLPALKGTLMPLQIHDDKFKMDDEK